MNLFDKKTNSYINSKIKLIVKRILDTGGPINNIRIDIIKDCDSIIVNTKIFESLFLDPLFTNRYKYKIEKNKRKMNNNSLKNLKTKSALTTTNIDNTKKIFNDTENIFINKSTVSAVTTIAHTVFDSTHNNSTSSNNELKTIKKNMKKNKSQKNNKNTKPEKTSKNNKSIKKKYNTNPKSTIPLSDISLTNTNRMLPNCASEDLKIKIYDLEKRINDLEEENDNLINMNTIIRVINNTLIKERNKLIDILCINNIDYNKI